MSAPLRNRIQSVQAAQKLVSALRLISAARIRASSLSALQTRPFAQNVQHMMARLLRHIRARGIDVRRIAHETPAYETQDAFTEADVGKLLLERLYLGLIREDMKLKRGAGVVLLVVFMADRKMCGGYNRDVFARCVIRIRELEALGRKVELCLVGRTGSTFAGSRLSNPVRYAIPLGGGKDAEHTASHVSQEILTSFVAGDIDRVEVVYTRFISLIVCTPSVRTILPLSPSGIEGPGDENFEVALTTNNGHLSTRRVKVAADVLVGGGELYDMDDAQAVLLLNSIIPMYVTSQMIRIVRESHASEQASRLTAMTAASDNAAELISNLRRRYNKERQAAITSEIIEVQQSHMPS